MALLSLTAYRKAGIYTAKRSVISPRTEHVFVDDECLYASDRSSLLHGVMYREHAGLKGRWRIRLNDR
jgi:hypothetical protein